MYMKTRILTMLSACTLLSACSSMEVLPSSEEAALTAQASRLVAAYNRSHGTDYPVPQVLFEDRPDEPSTLASADYTNWAITVYKSWMKTTPCLVSKEAIPHELAHLLVDYRHYGAPQAAVLPTRGGPKVVAFNGPPMLEDQADEHGSEWQVLARELGAHPCREGYCYSPWPYSKYPLRCGNPDTAELTVEYQVVPTNKSPRRSTSTVIARE